MTSGFTPENFNCLINSRHIDTENKLAFRIIKFRRYKKLVVADRVILSETPIAKANVDTIHALEALDLTLQSNPQAPVTEMFKEISKLYKTLSGQEKRQPQNSKGLTPTTECITPTSKGLTPTTEGIVNALIPSNNYEKY